MNSKQDFTAESPKNTKTGDTRHSRAKFSLVLAIITVLIIAAFLAGLLPRLRQHSNLSAATRESSIITVTVTSPKPGQGVSNLPLAAEIKPLIEAPIYARANGYLKRRLVDIGSYVEAGQLLAEVDTPELNQELDRARAQRDQAQAALELSKITAARWADLIKTASVSEQENAEKQADFKLKSASYESARAEVRRLEKLESFTRITAPFAGTITARNIDAGDLISAGSGKELFHLAQTRKLRIFVQVPQALARSIRNGQVAEVTIPEIPGKAFTAKVIRTAGTMASDSRTLLVELELDNPKGEIMAGGYAQARFTGTKMDAALTVPANAVLFRAEGPQVGVVRPDGKVELRSVKLGRDFGQTIEILAGVAMEDKVIVNPSDSLANGAAVSIAQSTNTEKAQ